jgi:membrane-bound lytic murein transglycosylase MltF
VKEIVVTGLAAAWIETIDDLAGKEIYVRRSSSYYGHPGALNDTLRARHLDPIKLVAGDENLEDEDLLEMVNPGLLPMIVVDNHMVSIWAKIFPKLVLRTDLVVNCGGEIAWAVRKHNPQLLALLNAFFREHGAGTAFVNTIKRRYFSDAKIVKNAYSQENAQRFGNVIDYFRHYGDTFAFDYLMIMAQGYQESQLDQSRRSPRGGVGIMQLLPPLPPIRPSELAASTRMRSGT